MKRLILYPVSALLLLSLSACVPDSYVYAPESTIDGSHSYWVEDKFILGQDTPIRFVTIGIGHDGVVIDIPVCPALYYDLEVGDIGRVWHDKWTGWDFVGEVNCDA